MAISFPVCLGRRISELREKRGLSQTQLADMAGIGRTHLSQIENGAVAARVDTLHAGAPKGHGGRHPREARSGANRSRRRRNGKRGVGQSRGGWMGRQRPTPES